MGTSVSGTTRLGVSHRGWNRSRSASVRRGTRAGRSRGGACWPAWPAASRPLAPRWRDAAGGRTAPRLTLARRSARLQPVTWSQISATTPRSWVTKRSSPCRAPVQPAEQVEDPSLTATSSAVVGSSAMSSFGSHASAIAIIARCRMPPEKLREYSFTRWDASGCRPVRASRRRAPMPASSTPFGVPADTDSAIWLPIVNAGSAPHRLLAAMAACLNPGRCAWCSRWRCATPDRRAGCSRRRPGPALGSRPMTVRTDTLFPEPLSPTTPAVSPAWTVNETSRR